MDFAQTTQARGTLTPAASADPADMERRAQGWLPHVQQALSALQTPQGQMMGLAMAQQMLANRGPFENNSLVSRATDAAMAGRTFQANVARANEIQQAKLREEARAQQALQLQGQELEDRERQSVRSDITSRRGQDITKSVAELNAETELERTNRTESGANARTAAQIAAQERIASTEADINRDRNRLTETQIYNEKLAAEREAQLKEQQQRLLNFQLNIEQEKAEAAAAAAGLKVNADLMNQAMKSASEAGMLNPEANPTKLFKQFYNQAAPGLGFQPLPTVEQKHLDAFASAYKAMVARGDPNPEATIASYITANADRMDFDATEAITKFNALVPTLSSGLAAPATNTTPAPTGAAPAAAPPAGPSQASKLLQQAKSLVSVGRGGVVLNQVRPYMALSTALALQERLSELSPEERAEAMSILPALKLSSKPGK